ncbi:MAG TPA: hypothetical protein VFB76_17495, partial [Candidatus Angelobacter sp.]|nr:hypothetical protein [Candidatus Angelobacter sp.]
MHQNLLTLRAAKPVSASSAAPSNAVSNGRPARSQTNGNSASHTDASSISGLKGFPALTQSLGKVSMKTLSASSAPVRERWLPGSHRS